MVATCCSFYKRFCLASVVAMYALATAGTALAQWTFVAPMDNGNIGALGDLSCNGTANTGNNGFTVAIFDKNNTQLQSAGGNSTTGMPPSWQATLTNPYTNGWPVGQYTIGVTPSAPDTGRTIIVTVL